MDKTLKVVLEDIDFLDRYLELAHRYDRAEKSRFVLEEVEQFITGLGYSVSFNKKEKFFKVKQKIGGFNIQLNIALPASTVEFILFIENKAQKVKAGGPFGLLAKQLNKKLERFYKVPFSDNRELEVVLTDGLALYQDILEAYEKQV